MSEEYVSIDRDELKRLQADSAELARLREQAANTAEACAVICEERAEYYKGDDDGGLRRSTACQACADVIRHRMPIAQARQLPEGFVLVPVEPTNAMLKATENIEIGASDWRGDKDIIEDYEAREVYLAMIAAAQGDSHE